MADTLTAPAAKADRGAFQFATQRSLMREIQVAWLASFFMGQLVDTDEAMRKAGINRVDLRRLLDDDEIEQATDTRRQAAVDTPWTLEGGSQKRAAQWVAEEIKPHVEEVLFGAWNAIPYGWSVVEVIYREAEAGRVGVQRVREKPFEWFVLDSSGTLFLRNPDVKDGLEAMDPRKFLVTVRNPSFLQPMGEPLFSRLFWPWFFRFNGWQFWLQWLERFGQPFLTGKTDNVSLPNGTSAVDALAEALDSAMKGSSLAVDSGTEVDVIQPGTGQHFPEFEQVVTGRIQKLILGQTLTSDTKGVGSYALGQVHNMVRQDKRASDLKRIGRAAQGLVDRLWTLNAFPGQPPEFRLQDPRGLEKERVERDKIAKETYGIQFVRDYVVERLDLEAEDFVMRGEEGFIETAVPGQAGRAPGGRSGQPSPDADDAPEDRQAIQASAVGAFMPKRFALDPSRFTPEQQALESLVTTAAKEAKEPIPDAEIRDAILGARDEFDLRNRLSALLANDAEAFEAHLARARYAAQVVGYVQATER